MTGGSLYGILKFFYGILDFSLGILEFRKSVIPQLDWGISIEILNLFIIDPPIKSGDDKNTQDRMTKNASQGNFYRDCPVKPDNDRKRELGGDDKIF